MTRAQNLVAAIAVLAACAAMAGIYFAGHEIYRTIGPSKAVAAADGNLYLVSHGKIHVFGPDGKRRAAYGLDLLGASLTPSDLAVHRDGRIVAASPDGSNLRRCTLATLSCETLDPGLTGVPAQHVLPLNSVKIAIDEGRGLYYLSDNAGHRVVVADFAGKRLSATEPYVVWYPNQLALEAPDELRVVDTNHRRIANFRITGNTIGRMLRSMPTLAAGVARPGREWPFDALRVPSGDTWALVAVEGMKDADLVVYDANGHAERRIDLGDDSDPFDIELWRDRVIVSDAMNYRVDAIGLDGKRAAAFDDPRFDQELAVARERPQRWRLARTASQVAVIAIPLIAILVLKLMGAQFSAAPPPPPSREPVMPVPLDNTVRWITIRPAYFEEVRREAKRNAWMVLGMVAALGLFAYFAFGTHLDRQTQRFAVMFVAIAAVQFLVMPLTLKRAGRQFEKYRLGVSASGLDYELPKALAPFGNAKGRSPWREVFWDGARLMAGKKILMLRAQRGPAFFEPAEIQGSIVANIPKANHLTQNAMTMRAAGALVWVLIAVIVGLAAWLILARSL